MKYYSLRFSNDLRFKYYNSYFFDLFLLFLLASRHGDDGVVGVEAAVVVPSLEVDVSTGSPAAAPGVLDDDGSAGVAYSGDCVVGGGSAVVVSELSSSVPLRAAGHLESHGDGSS